MSLNINQMPVKIVVDPRLEISGSKTYIAVKGAQVVNWQQYPAVNVNNSSFQISCNPPNRDIAIGRLVLKRVAFQWQITGTNTSGGTLLNSGFIAPRAMPLTCVTQSEQMTINNDTIAQAPVQQYWRALLRYRNDFFDRFGALSMAPSMLDQFQTYAEGAGSVRNPLAAYGDNSFENTRGGFVGFTIDPQVPGNTVATGTLITTEPVLISPFCHGERANHFAAFAGIQNMSYTATLGNLSRILSVVQGQGAAGGQIVLQEPVVNITAASLLFNYLTPDPMYPIPRKMETSYFSLVSYPTRSLVPVAAGAQIQLTLNSVQVSSIPKRLYIFAKSDDSQETAYTSDTYLSLSATANPLTVTWQNNQFLSQATAQDLYNISVKNGCNQSWSQYIGRTGSVLALDFGLDIGLAPNQAPGSLGNYQLGLTVNFTNTSSETVLPTLYCVVVSEGVFNMTDGSCSHALGVLSPADIMNAERMPVGSYKQSEDIYGGKFELLKSIVQKAGKYIKENKLISRGLSLIPDPRFQIASGTAALMGYGASGGAVDDYGGALDDYGGSMASESAPAPRPRGRPKKTVPAAAATSGMNLSDLA